MLKTIKGHTSGIFTLGGTFIIDKHNEPTWSTKQSDIEAAMVADMEGIFKSRVSTPDSQAQRRARDFTTAMGMEGWIQSSLGELKHEPSDYKNLDEKATITVEDVRWALKFSSKGKARGLTGLTNVILFHSSDYNTTPSKFYDYGPSNRCYSTRLAGGTYPSNPPK